MTEYIRSVSVSEPVTTGKPSEQLANPSRVFGEVDGREEHFH
jgi:hypothetical protein